MAKIKQDINSITFNGIEYVKKDSIESNKMAVNTDGLRYVIARTYSAGVFAGHLQSRNGQECVLINARRIYYWEGAATLSQLSVDGTSKPDQCKFPTQVSRVELLQTIEILDCTEKAQKSIEGVKTWKQ